MRKQPYLPPRESARITWFNDFALNLASLVGVLAAVTAGIVGGIVADAAFYQSVVESSQSIDQFKQSVTDFKKRLSYAPQGTVLGPFPAFSITLGTAVNAGVFTRLATLVQSIKSDPDYTNAMGELLGIVGDDSIFNELTAKTTLKLTFSAGQVIIDFTKPREVDGVKIFSKRATETTWSFLAIDTQSPYNDTRPNLVADQPEKREYKASYIVDDHIIGLESDVVSIVVNIS